MRNRRESRPPTTVRLVASVGTFTVLFFVFLTVWEVLEGDDLGDVVGENAVQSVVSGTLWAAFMWFVVWRPAARADRPPGHP